eukprot:12420883-Karenia_brevis.AAC.1
MRCSPELQHAVAASGFDWIARCDLFTQFPAMEILVPALNDQRRCGAFKALADVTGMMSDAVH